MSQERTSSSLSWRFSTLERWARSWARSTSTTYVSAMARPLSCEVRQDIVPRGAIWSTGNFGRLGDFEAGEHAHGYVGMAPDTMSYGSTLPGGLGGKGGQVVSWDLMSL